MMLRDVETVADSTTEIKLVVFAKMINELGTVDGKLVDHVKNS
jgi:hypothetical protein